MSSLNELENKLKARLCELKSNHRINELFLILDRLGDSFIIGGAVRDWILDHSPRDIDIAVSLNEETNLYEKLRAFSPLKTNRFGGISFDIGGLDFDVWEIKNTWGIKKMNLNSDIQSLLSTTFISIDSVAFQPKNSVIYDGGFIDSINSNSISIIFEDNPNPLGCLIKIIYSSKKYNLNLHKSAINYIKNLANLDMAWDQISEYQIRHYNREVVSKKTFNTFVKSI